MIKKRFTFNTFLVLKGSVPSLNILCRKILDILINSKEVEVTRQTLCFSIFLTNQSTYYYMNLLLNYQIIYYHFLKYFKVFLNHLLQISIRRYILLIFHRNLTSSKLQESLLLCEDVSIQLSLTYR